MLRQTVSPFQYVTQIFKILLIGVVVLAILFGLNHVKLSAYFPIKAVKVYGINRVDHVEVQRLLLPLVDGGFFGIHVEYIRERLLQMPWVSDIFVRRTWPDSVEVTVIEKNPLARWNNQSLLSDVGELFTPKEETYPEALPLFVGPNGKHVMMLDYYNQINRLLLPLHAKIAHLELTPYLTWKLILDNGVALQMGHKDVLLRLSQFVKVYPKVVGDRAKDVDYIDLRYPSGVAVRWKR